MGSGGRGCWKCNGAVPLLCAVDKPRLACASCSHLPATPLPPHQVRAAAVCGGQAVAAAAAGDRAHAACVGGPQMTQCDLLAILKVRGASKENMGIEGARGKTFQGS